MSRVEDELALRDLMATYVDAVYRNDGETWKSTWAEDSIWDLAGMEAIGRDNIFALWQQAMAGFEFALMVPSVSRFDIEGDRASGFWYLQEFTRGRDGTTGNVVSCYRDTCVRDNGRWLYETRRYSFIYNGPADLSGSYTPPGD